MIGRNHSVGTAPIVVSGGMRVRVLPTTDLATVGPIWQAVDRHVGFNGLACSWEWTATWLRYYGDLIPHRIVVGESDGPRAIALISEGVGQYRGPIPVRTLHLGTAGEPEADTIAVECNRLLVSPADRHAFSKGILRAIDETGLRGDELVWDGFVPEEISSFLELDRSFTPDRRICYVAELAAIRAEGGCFLGALRKHTAAKIRRSARRLEEAHGAIRVEWARSRDGARQMFDELVVLHQARWRKDGQPGSFASCRFAGFHREIVDRLFDAGHILLARVSAGDHTIGCDYGFVDHNRVLSYQWGLAQFDDRHLSPGLVTGAVVMQAALERGLNEYSWLAGDVLYKRELSTTSRELVWAQAQRSARIHVIHGAAKVKRLAQRFGLPRTVTDAIVPHHQQDHRTMRTPAAQTSPASVQVRTRPIASEESMGTNKIELAATVLQRSRGAAVLRQTPTWSGVLTLNYHRIGHTANMPFHTDVISATPDDFDRQLAYLARHADVIGGQDLPTVLQAKRGRHVMITFDDGYLDNYEIAFPLLRRHGLPATFFICTGLLDGRGVAWWDEIAWMIRTSRRRELPTSDWLPSPIALNGNRKSAVHTAIERFRALPDERTAAFLDHVGDAAGTGRADASLARDLWMTWDNVREMQAQGMTIGAHTVTHPILSRLSAERQYEEIAGSRARLAVELGQAPRLFAYPVGKPYTFNADTRAALQASGFGYAFSFYGGHQPFAPVDPYDLRRTYVDWRTTMPVFEAKVTLPKVFARW